MPGAKIDASLFSCLHANVSFFHPHESRSCSYIVAVAKNDASHVNPQEGCIAA